MKYSKRSAAAAVIALCLLAAGCGSAAKDEHSQHAGGNAAETAGNEHSGHSSHEQTTKSDLSDIKVEWRYSPERPKAGEETRIELFLYQPSGKPIEKYDINHEKLMHLIVVNEDMTEFSHIHPEYKGKGKFEIVTSFAKSGSYKLFADIIPSGYSQMTITSQLKVSGAKQAEQPLEKDAALLRTVDDVVASLSLTSFQSGQTVDLTFTLKDEKTQQPITDLQPYLGAIGHVVILSEDLNSYLHVHPKNINESGPTAEFSTEFPAPGLYKIWGQFQREGKTFIVPFTIEVK
ncbi:hypothetical protein BK133_14555 [Paenibacillus sp. FSL H8-0548]|uniref:hypothetical protein n=1 Tax=Paenibacillus sp. FSL H8-0548 TaxID=1920422 RepID=UPI00096F61FD|nr:hypothetical protein [Paenibacillus sp. FSL H8-0548]OMF32242.1 hypothetical protein BK133_14555 [Paenibacillus sp. FSL H8-0548]